MKLLTLQNYRWHTLTGFGIEMRWSGKEQQRNLFYVETVVVVCARCIEKKKKIGVFSETTNSRKLANGQS